MRRIACVLVLLAAGAVAPAGCSCNSTASGASDANGTGDGGVCDPACSGDLVCRYMTCVPPPAPCTTNTDCTGDDHCDVPTSECLPWGVGDGTPSSDPTCKRTPVPGVFFPNAQCEWTAPPAGDPYPGHINVLATPMVATFYQSGEFSTPSIVFTSYNFTDGSAQSCEGTDPNYFGVIRIIDGRTCMQQATIAAPTVVASASVAIADLGGADGTPEIVAARTDGGLVAFTLDPTAGWTVLWQTTSTFGDLNCDWAGPSIHDLDNDGKPEIVFYGNVYDGATGATIDESLGATVDAIGTGYVPVIADVDGDGKAEMITSKALYTWDTTARKWALVNTLPGGDGHVAVADFGTYTADASADNRGALDGVPEIAVIYAGTAKVFTLGGRQVFSANLTYSDTDPMHRIGQGGPPTIADFDGDGRVEFASAGASAYQVFDPDCEGTPAAATCPSLRTDGILWVQSSQDYSSNTTGSSVFDFDGDGRAEVVYGDECFTRVYDGVTGKVVYSRYRTSCTWYENPVIADTDADFNAEIVSTSNTNCATTCPAVDPIFDGVQCLDDSDCPSTTTCGREAASDALGRCRCTQDADCGNDGFVCLDPAAGASAAGKVCRASHPADAEASGVRVLADSLDRWINTRSIWNQHAYSVTNIGDDGKVPKTSAWLANWKQPGLNNYRQNSPGTGETAGAIADLTVKQAKVSCDASGPTIVADVCNRGTEPVAQGLPVAVYGSGTGGARALECTTATVGRLYPGDCETVQCAWTGSERGAGSVVVDDRGNGMGIDSECREDNNTLAITVSCP
jgi:hypothetical protein